MQLQKIIAAFLCAMAFACATRTKPAPIENITNVPSYLQAKPATTAHAAALANPANSQNNANGTHLSALSNSSQNTTATTSQAASVSSSTEHTAAAADAGTGGAVAASSGHRRHHKQSASAVQETSSVDNQTISSNDIGQEWSMPTHSGKITKYKTLAKGIDIYGKEGQGIYAVNGGRVVYSGNGLKGYGNLIIIKHNATYLSAYAHNKVNLVQEGATVVRGQKIATMGDNDSGKATLHFELRQNGRPIDPFTIINGSK